MYIIKADRAKIWYTVSSYFLLLEASRKSKAEYKTDKHFELDLPVAPAVMVGDEIVFEANTKSVTVTKEDKFS